MRHKSQERERKAARLARRQHGVIASRQLQALGFSRGQIVRRVAHAHLHRLHRGVYAVGHTNLSMRGRWMAAVLAAGSDAVLSHRAAAALWDLRPPPSTAPVDVTAPAAGRRQRPGIRLHTTTALPRADRQVLDGIPVTSVARTLLDIAEVLSPPWLRLAVEAAERRDRLDLNEVHALLYRSYGRHGLKPLSAILAEVAEREGEAPWTQSQKEDHMLALCRKNGVPEPRCNVIVHGFRVDFRWPEHGLVVEVDSWHWHRSHAKFESDRREDATMQLAGEAILRPTQRLLTHNPDKAVAEIMAMLERGAAARARAPAA